MKSKDKQIRELRNSRNLWRLLGVFFIFISLITVGFESYYEHKSYNLETQLQSYQDKVPVWTLKAHCIVDFEGMSINRAIWKTTYDISFYDYGEYKETLESLSESENCEVVSE